MKNKNLTLVTLLAFVLFHLTASAQEMHMQHAKAPKSEFLVLMDTMMYNMDKAPKGNSKSAYFINQMIPHHTGAIQMAKYEIDNGKDKEMIQLAKSILAEQQTEIIQMQELLKKLDGHDSLDETFLKAMEATMINMMSALPVKDILTNIDQEFASTMLPHHQAAVEMAKLIIGKNSDKNLNSFAKMLISNEQIEIDQMTSYLKKL